MRESSFTEEEEGRGSLDLGTGLCVSFSLLLYQKTEEREERKEVRYFGDR